MTLWLLAKCCLAAICAGVTVIGLMVLFLVLCIVMRAIGYILSYSFNKVLNRPDGV